jgi:hypothetical protein
MNWRLKKSSCRPQDQDRDNFEKPDQQQLERMHSPQPGTKLDVSRKALVDDTDSRES